MGEDARQRARQGGSGLWGGVTARQPDSSIRLHAGQRLSGHSGVSLQTG